MVCSHRAVQSNRGLDGSSCNTNGHCIDLKDKAELTVYGHEKGTGIFSIYHSPADGAKDATLGGPSPLIEDKNMYWHTELGSFSLYGGIVNIESTGYCAAHLMDLTVMGGTLTAKTVESYTTISMPTRTPTLAENYKVCKADNPQEKIEFTNTKGIKVLITECTEHVWGYATSETKGMHKVACKLCSVYREEAHDFRLNGGICNEMRHYLKCACGVLSQSTSYHELVYIPNYDTLTHRYACKVCDYARDDGHEEHDFTKNQALCADCGFKRGASVKIGDTVTNYGRFEDAIDKVSGAAGSNTGGTVNLYGKEDCFDGKQINVKWGIFTVDFNGADLTLPGISLFDIQQSADVTLKNGKINLAGDIPYRDVPGIRDSSESKSGTINKAKLLGGKLTVNGGSISSIDINDGETSISDAAAGNVNVYGGKTEVLGGTVSRITAEGGEKHISGGLTKNFGIKGGKIYVTNGTVTDFKMSIGEIYISDGDFKKVSVDISDSDGENPKLEITGGIFDDAAFTAKTKGRITISGGIFKKIIVGEKSESTVRTVGDLLADGYMFHSMDDNTLILGDKNILSVSAEVRLHRHSDTEKLGADGKYYGECACGVKTAAVIEKPDLRTYYDTFEKAAEAVSQNDTLRLCSDAECADDVTIEGKGNYKNRIKLNLDGHSLNFAEGKRLRLIYAYIDIIDSGNGYISYLYVNWPTAQLYGGTYGKVETDGNMVKGLRGNGCGFKRTANNEWITDFTWVSSLTDVAVREAPYTVKAIATNMPDGTETPEVLYAGQKLYFKPIFRTYSLDPISESNPATCSVDYIRADGKTRVVGTNVPVTGEDAFISEILPEDVPDASICLAGWTFTPTGDNSYMYAAVSGKATITVNQATFPNDKITVRPKSIDNLIYDGSREMELITAGTTEIGTMQYRLGENREWKTEIPKAANAGSYDVYYRVTGDDNYNESAPEKVSCSIAKRSVAITNKSYKTTYMYGNAVFAPEESEFEITGLESGAVFSYEWIDTKPEMYSELGEYKVKVTVGESNNTMGGSLEIPVTIVQNTNTEYIGGSEYNVYNNAD